jgi:hypothetical protein
MRVLKISAFALVATLDLISTTLGLPMENHDDFVHKLGALSLADTSTSTPSSSHLSHHQAATPQPTKVNNAAPPSHPIYHITSPAEVVSMKDFSYNHQFINPKIHLPSKIESWNERLDKKRQEGSLEEHVYHADKSRARVASVGLQHIMSGKPVRTVLHDGVKVLHKPGTLNAAMYAHFNDHIHQIEATGKPQDPYRITSPRNKTNTPLTPEQRIALHRELENKVNGVEEIRKSPKPVKSKSEGHGKSRRARKTARVKPY